MIYNWMKNIVIYLILSGIVINITPNSNYKKYIDFLSGLIVIIILAEPLTYIFNLGGGDINQIYDDLNSFVEENKLSSQESGVERVDYYGMSLNESIMSYLNALGYEVSQVSVITDSDNNISECIIMTEEAKDIVVEIKNVISEVYNVEVDSIYIVRR